MAVSRMSVVGALAALLFAGAAMAQTYPNMLAAVGGEQANIVKLLISSGGLTAGFSDANAGPFTFFVPSDKAMYQTAKSTPLGNAGVLSNQCLLKLILQYHLVSGTVSKPGSYSTQLKRAGIAPITVTKAGPGGQVKAAASTANIIKGPIKAGKSTVYVIDAMLLPTPVNKPLAC